VAYFIKKQNTMTTQTTAGQAGQTFNEKYEWVRTQIKGVKADTPAASNQPSAQAVTCGLVENQLKKVCETVTGSNSQPSSKPALVYDAMIVTGRYPQPKIISDCPQKILRAMSLETLYCVANETKSVIAVTIDNERVVLNCTTSDRDALYHIFKEKGCFTSEFYSRLIDFGRPSPFSKFRVMDEKEGKILFEGYAEQMLKFVTQYKASYGVYFFNKNKDAFQKLCSFNFYFATPTTYTIRNFFKQYGLFTPSYYRSKKAYFNAIKENNNSKN
jgi:hypothetical protein